MTNWPDFIGIPLWIWIFGLPLAIALFAAIQAEIISRIFQPLWAILDRVYTISGYIAAYFMCVILLITIGQMGSRWLGLTFEGSTEFAGYAMAATSFFALAHAKARQSLQTIKAQPSIESYPSRIVPFHNAWETKTNHVHPHRQVCRSAEIESTSTSTLES